jgi:hypothetical protein
MIAFTFGPQRRYPVLMIGQPDQVPLNEFTQGVAAMLDRGLTVRAREVRERYGLTAPEPGDEKLQAKAASGSGPKLPEAQAPDDPEADLQAARPFLGRLLTLQAEASPELVERLTERVAAEAAGALAGMTGRVRRAFEEATDMRDLAHRLAQLHLPQQQFAEAMARGMALAHLAGQAELLDEVGLARHARLDARERDDLADDDFAVPGKRKLPIHDRSHVEAPGHRHQRVKVTTTIEAIDLPFEEAIDFFRQKARLPSKSWSEVYAEAHARGFAVAGATSDALLKDFQEAIRKALERGTTLAEFRQDFDRIVKTYGWEHTGTPGWRAQVIYETNLSTAYSAGRYAQLTDPDVLRHYPYWEYRHSGSRHPRLMHLAWNGLTLRADDPWWDSHYPPNGWHCGCRVSPVSDAGLRRMGKTGPDPSPEIATKPWVNPATGHTHQVPVGIDPGFEYNVGKAWKQGRAAELPVRAPRLRPQGGREPQPSDAQLDAIRQFVRKPESRVSVGRLAEAVRQTLGIQAEEALLSADTMAKQRREHPELTEQEYLLLPLILGAPDLVLQWEELRVALLRAGAHDLTAVVKATRDKQEAYVVSFRRTEAKDVRRMIRKGRVIAGDVKEWSRR